MSADVVTALCATALFAGVDESTVRGLAPRAVRLAGGDVLVAEGQDADGLFVVLSGRLRVLARQDDGAVAQIGEIVPGGVVGEIATVAGGTRVATVAAVTDAEVVALSDRDLTVLLDACPGLAERLSDLAVQRLRRAQLARVLRRLFGALDLTVLAEFEAQVEWVSLRAGETLFEEGAEGDAAFVLLSGRLRAQLRSRASEVGTGEIVGEMALLSAEPRSATLVAVRDTQLARLSRAAFDRLYARHPQVMAGITRTLVDRLRQLLAGRPRPSGDRWVLTLVPAAPDVDVATLRRELTAALAADAPTVELNRDATDERLGRRGAGQAAEHDPVGIRVDRWLDDLEERHRFVVYEADPSWTGWTQRVAGRADRLLVVGEPGGSPLPTGPEAALLRLGYAAPSALVLRHPADAAEPSGTGAWLAERPGYDHYHVRAGSEPDVARLARLVTDRGIAVVLGGGGARGFAHIGALRALEEAGVPIDVIGGTSIGAIMAGIWANERTWRGLRRVVTEQFVKLLDYTVPLVALTAGRRITRNLYRGLGERLIEDLWVPYFAVGTNLTDGRIQIYRRGQLARAARISASIPGVLPPLTDNGDLLADGGLLNNLPIDIARELVPDGTVIAVDVNPPVALTGNAPLDGSLSGWRMLANAVTPRARRQRIPGIVKVLVRSTFVAGLETRARHADLADLILSPTIKGVGMLEFDKVDPVADTAYEQTIEQVREWASHLSHT